MKVKILLPFILFSLVLQGSVGRSDEISPSNQLIQKVLVGGNLINYSYVEPGLISHSGYMYQIFARASWNSFYGFTGVVDAELSAGMLNYDGSSCDVNTNACSDYKSKTNDLIFKAVHRFNFLFSERYEFFAGPGIRYLYDKGVGAGFYTRIGTYFFIPFGMTINFAGWSGYFNLELEYDLFLTGMMKSRISEVNPTFTDINHRQYQGSGSKVLLRYHLQNSKTFLSLAYENWKIADSNIEPLLINGVRSGSFFIEPNNFTDSVSLGAGYQF